MTSKEKEISSKNIETFIIFVITFVLIYKTN